MRTSWEEVPGRLGKWLDRYTVIGTKTGYMNCLKIFFKVIYGATFEELRSRSPELTAQRRKRQFIQLNEYIEQYISEHEERNFIDDLITMIKWIKNHPKPYSYGTAGAAYGSVKKFFSRQPENRIDHRYTISEIDDDDIKTLLPKRGEKLRDDKLTKAQLRSIMEHLSIQHKAFSLFAASTGMRPSAITRILLEDMNLKADPPFAYLVQKEDGKSVPPQIWFSYEARDAILEWQKVLPTIRKKTGGVYDPNTPLKVSYSDAWTTALKKTGLDQKYKMARKEQHIYHFGTLRKFFYTNMKNDGMDLDIVNAMMGHEAYLADAYDKTGVEKLAEIYLKHMDAVQIYVKDDEMIQKELTISDDDLDAYQALGWKWKGAASKDRAIIEWKEPERPKYPEEVDDK